MLSISIQDYVYDQSIQELDAQCICLFQHYCFYHFHLVCLMTHLTEAIKEILPIVAATFLLEQYSSYFCLSLSYLCTDMAMQKFIPWVRIQNLVS